MEHGDGPDDRRAAYPLAHPLTLGVAAGLLCCLIGCAGGVGHPIRTSLPRLPPGAWPPDPPVGLPEPAPLAGEPGLRQLFVGEPAILKALLWLRGEAPTPGRTPTLIRLPKLEQSFVRRYRGGGPAGPIRYVTALGTTGVVPIPPQAFADVIEDPAAERFALDADAFRPLGVEHAVPGHTRRRFWVDLLQRGAGPLRFDLRFGLTSERLTLPGGTVLIRFDPLLKPRPTIVTMYRGGVILEPAGTGTRVTEVLVFGNALLVPPPLWKVLRPLVELTQRNRSINLWRHAYAKVEPATGAEPKK